MASARRVKMADISSGKMMIIPSQKQKSSIFSKLSLGICTRRAYRDILVLQAARSLSAPRQSNVMRAAGAWRGRVVCRYPTSLSEKLKFSPHTSSLSLCHVSKSFFSLFAVLQYSASSSTANMKISKSSGGSGNVSRSLSTRLVDTSRRKEFGEKFEILSVSMEECLQWTVGAGTASFQQAVAVLSAETENRRSQKFVSLFITS